MGADGAPEEEADGKKRQPEGPRLWLHGAGLADFVRWMPLVRALVALNPRHGILLTAGDATVRRELARAYPDAVVAGLPLNLDIAVRRFLGRYKPHVLLIASPEGLGQMVYDRACRWRFPVLALGAAPWIAAGKDGLFRSQALAADHFLVASEAEAGLAGALAAGDTAKVAVIPSLNGEEDGSRTDAARRISALITKDWIAAGERRGLVRLAHALLSGPAGRWYKAARTSHLAALDAINERLGWPKTILCLGNGPSSEDPALAALAYDSLFRVNCRWRGTGRHEKPHIVFSGIADCLFARSGLIAGLRTCGEEEQILLRHMLRVTPWRLTYLTVERLPTVLGSRTWGARPTNGAAMVALAAALEPERLVIAGIDLFSHPAGAYPGDCTEANAYNIRHSRDVEVEILSEVLASYKGQTLLAKGPLYDELAARGVLPGIKLVG